MTLEQHSSYQQSIKPWVVVMSASLFFFYEFIQLNLFSAIDPELMRTFAINATQLGQLSSMYFYANIAFLFVAGPLLDRYSTRTIILIALAICVGGTFAFANATTYHWAAVFRSLTGIGSAFCFLSCIRLATRWFPSHRLALVAGLIVTMAMAGGMVAQTPMTLLVEHYGWRHALYVDAALGLFIVFAIIFFVKDYPAEEHQHQAADHEQLNHLGYWKSYKLAFLNPQNWLGGIYTSLLNLPIFIIGALWGSLYLKQVHHLTRTQAADVTMMVFLGTVIGSPIAGWISDRIKRRKRPMVIGAIASLALILAIIYLPNLSFNNLLILFFGLGLITSTQVISYPTIAENNPSALTATAVSVISICAIGGGAIFQPLFGWIMDRQGDSVIRHHLHVYSTADYHTAILIIPIAFVVALLATLFIHETHCRPYDGNDDSTTVRHP